MLYFAGMGRRTQSKFDVLVCENTIVLTYLVSGASKDIRSYTLFAERPNTQQMLHLDGLSLCKISQYSVLPG